MVCNWILVALLALDVRIYFVAVILNMQIYVLTMYAVSGRFLYNKRRYISNTNILIYIYTYSSA